MCPLVHVKVLMFWVIYDLFVTFIWMLLRDVSYVVSTSVMDELEHSDSVCLREISK